MRKPVSEAALVERVAMTSAPVFMSDPSITLGTKWFLGLPQVFGGTARRVTTARFYGRTPKSVLHGQLACQFRGRACCWLSSGCEQRVRWQAAAGKGFPLFVRDIAHGTKVVWPFLRLSTVRLTSSQHVHRRTAFCTCASSSFQCRVRMYGKHLGHEG